MTEKTTVTSTLEPNGMNGHLSTLDDSIESVVLLMRHIKKQAPTKFVDLVREFQREAAGIEADQTGSNHPLAEILSQKPSQESLNALREGISEYRHSIEIDEQ